MKNSLNVQIGNFLAGNFAIVTKENAAEIGWGEFTCRATSLARKTRRCFNQLKLVAPNLGLDINTIYANLKNVEPTEGKLYDIIELRDLETDELKMTIVPKSGIAGAENKGFVIIGKSKKKAAEGSWSEIKEYFLDKNPNDKELVLRRNLPGCPKGTKFEKHGKVYQNEKVEESDIQYKFTKEDIENHKKWFLQDKVEFVEVDPIYSPQEVAKATSDSESSEGSDTDTDMEVNAELVAKSEIAESAESAVDAIK